MEPVLQFEAIPYATPVRAPLVVELVPAPEPWDVARRLAHLPNLLFLDSAERHDTRGRNSYVMADPGTFTRRLVGRGLTPFTALVQQTHLQASKWSAELPPFRGGLAGLFGYGLNRAFETVPKFGFDEFQLPDLACGIYDWVISFDHQTNRAWLISTGYPERTDVKRWKVAKQRLNAVLDILASAGGISESHVATLDAISKHRLVLQSPLPGFPGVSSNFTRAEYEAAVGRVIDYIRAGDCYQVNLAQRLLAPLREHPLELYGRLRERNPAPFAAYFDLGEFQILSASPERFLQVTDGEVETRPIKGTRTRGRTPDEDAALVADLSTSAKDRAENVMIVDLLRNDLGKVCEYGSVRVPRVCEVETFRFVHHLVSEVRGRLRTGLSPLDLLAAAFPGGSVTGAPKVRAMEIIAELEPTARGPYCGSLGYIGFDGSMDTNILIRTFTAGRGWVQFPVGGGIVADSDPAREYEETLHKAAGLLQALAHR